MPLTTRVSLSPLTRIVLLAIALGSGALASRCAGQESRFNDQVPEAIDYFCNPAVDAPDFAPAVRIALVPERFVFDTPAKPLAATVQPSSVPPGRASEPVALVSYEQAMPDETAAGEATPAVQPLEWDWLPSDTDPADQKRLDQMAAAINHTRKSIENAEGLAAEVRDSSIKNITLAEERLESARKMLARINSLQQEINAAPVHLKELETALAAKLPAIPESLDEQVGIEVHQAALTEQQQNEQRIRSELAAIETRIADRAKLLAGLADRRTQLREKLKTAETNRQQLTGDQSQRPLLLENQATAIASQLGLALCDVEQAWCSAMEKVGPLRRDNMKRQLDHAAAATQALNTLVGELRSKLAREEEQRARRAAANAHPLVEDLAKENSKLAQERSRIAEQIQADKVEQKELDALLESMETVGKRLKKHVDAAGHSQAVGIMLRHHRTQLPQTNRHRLRINQIKSSMPDISLQQLTIREELDALANQQATLHSTIAEMDTTQTSVSADELEKMANELLTTKRKYLYELSTDFETYVTGLSNLEESHENSIKTINELKLFIDQHVLWIRSAQPLDSGVIRESLSAIQAIGATRQWQDLAGGLSSKLTTRWPVLVMIGLGLWLAIGMRQQLDRRLRIVSRRRNDLRLSPIMRSLTQTLMQASFFPGLVATLGWLLSEPYESGSLKDSISHGLLIIVPQLFIGSVIYRFCIRGGLAEAQLSWVPEATSAVRCAAGRILRYCLPLLAVTYTLEFYDGGRWGDSLGRLVFIVAMLLFSWASLLLLRGMGRCWRQDTQSSRSVWVQTFGLWAPVVVVAPLALASVAALGFHYSSVFLAGRLLMTWWVLLGVVSTYYIVRRMVDIGQNIITARRRWGKSAVTGDDAQSGGHAPDSEDLSIKLQVGRLLHVSSMAVFLLAAMALWAEVLPAIGALDIGVWGPIERQVKFINEEGLTETMTDLQWITVGNLLVCSLILTATVVLSRNLPGLMEMTILDRLPLDRGGKYAISIVCRYLVGTIGLVIASRTIGFSWHSVQWLVAAMGVGLGFGLQEIFANFISGIIILLERPIRAGDMVTVNGVTGFVTKMQLRATTIMDFDRRELIVPNKKFITDDVINWTLTDSVTRMIIRVGIAYGSDTKLAQRSLLKVARQHPVVLKDPAPQVIFSSFGASSLDFELRVHIPDRARYPEMQHDLHMAIDEEFRRQKIEIAFPQQDVHVKGVEHLLGRSAADSDDKQAA